MKWFLDLRLARKLSIGFGLCLALSFAITITAYSAIRNLNRDIHSLSDDALAGMIDLNEASFSSGRSRTLQFRIVERSPAERGELLKEEEAAEAKTTAAIDHYKSTVTDPTDRINIEELDKNWKAFQAAWIQTQTDLSGADPKAAVKVLERNTVQSFTQGFLPVLKRMADWNADYAQKLTKRSDQSVATAVTDLLLAFAFSLIVGIGAALAITKSIVIPVSAVAERLATLRSKCVKNLASGMRSLAKGDLTESVVLVTQPITGFHRDEVGQMAEAFNAMLEEVSDTTESYNQAREQLSALVGKVAQNAVSVSLMSESLAAAAEQCTAAASEIAAGSEKLASSATGAAAGMESLSLGASQVDATSNQQLEYVEKSQTVLITAATEISLVSRSAEEMRRLSIEGGTAVAETVRAMESVSSHVELSANQVQQLDEKGAEIGKIVEAIQLIADQTNLLALNAAIEAARAGEQGRGFAIVADEVRKLAEQSSSSAKQISELIHAVQRMVEETVKAIKGTTQQVQIGTEKSAVAGKTLESMLLAAQTVSGQANEVAKLSGSVTTTMNQVANAVHSNHSASQEMIRGSLSLQTTIEGVAAVSEESAAGAEELTASINEVGAAATNLAQMSSDLKDLVESFKVIEQPRQSVRAA